MNNLPITVISVVLNGAGTIRDCIESVINQTHRPIEHIIIDGGSTDGTLCIIEEYRSNLAEVVSERDSGIYDGMNKGLRLATGGIIGILNVDDFYARQDTLEIFCNRAIYSEVEKILYLKGESV